jgi:hypothetical protein
MVPFDEKMRKDQHQKWGGDGGNNGDTSWKKWCHDSTTVAFLAALFGMWSLCLSSSIPSMLLLMANPGKIVARINGGRAEGGGWWWRVLHNDDNIVVFSRRRNKVLNIDVW